MKKKAQKRLIKQIISGCKLAGKLVILAALVAFFTMQFDTMRILLIRDVVQDTLRHCPSPKTQEYLPPPGVLETVHQDSFIGHRNKPT